ncbi:uncharacterized protein LOC107882870 [Acyrthosiphon pisum]|uniref:DUF659 domain-containing protein n=1 Tax=Acyrthosiphon pisum TaxID=7029 RepID=A0A8R2D299_ACYPI|nr:uncharacterized protein LOC107882870 [Acyrthosiphon pisum]|eukprot:XP_016657408.1 PREDICTED: uncharacterized protein LOC107882870 [Acyrthosiphon pisum]
MGKVKSLIHKCFRQVTMNEGNKKVTKNICNYCNWGTVPNATRQKKHIRCCVKCPMAVKSNILQMKKSSHANNLNSADVDYNDEVVEDCPLLSISNDIPVESSSMSTPPIDIFIRPFFDENQEHLTTSTLNTTTNFDKVIESSKNALVDSLTTEKNVYWKEFFKKIRPAYCPPSTYIISNRLLDDEYKRVKECTDNNILSAKVLGVMCDGWTNLRNESIVNFVVTTPNPVFFKSISTGTDRHTGEKMAEEIISVIEEIGQTKVFGIVTDNAKNMKKAWHLVNEKYPHITAYGCVAHGLNLLVNDMMNLKLFNDVINEGKSVSMSINEAIEKDLKPEVKKLISSANFWDKIYYFHQVVNPLAKWIKIIESDVPKLSSVPFIFKELETSFKNTIQKSHLLDPKYLGKCLNTEEHSDAVEFIYQLSKKLDNLDVGARQVIADLCHFKNKTGPFCKEYLWAAINDTNGLNWWNAFCSEIELSKIAIKILSLLATSAAVERTFSSYKDVHSLKRNRLINERASKLVLKLLKYEKPDKINDLLVNDPTPDVENFDHELAELQEKNSISDLEIETDSIDSNGEGSRSGIDSFFNEVSSELKIKF